MVYAGNHTLMTVSGTSFTGAEQWSFGLRFSGSPALTQAMADNAAALWKTWITTASSGYYAQTQLTEVKLAPMDNTGHYPDGLDSVVSNPAAAVGAFVGTQVYPPQIALAITATTAKPRGSAHNTHFFLPAPGYALESASSPRISTGNAGTILANLKTCINGLNALGFGSFTAMSKKYGTQNTVTGLLCGRVYDTIRSRRRSITELPASLAL